MPRDYGDWRSSAACGMESADAFFIAVGALSAENQMALRVCGGCPVRRECDADADAHPLDYGRWIAGGRVHRAARRTNGKSWAASA